VDVFTVVSAVIVIAFLATTILLGVFSKRSALEILDWKPTRSPEVEASNELDDVAQMIEAQNEIRRRRGKPERTLEDIESEWRGS
jgi:preprotein translocase subunit SecG